MVMRVDVTAFFGFGFISYLGDFIGSKLFNEKRWFVVPMM